MDAPFCIRGVRYIARRRPKDCQTASAPLASSPFSHRASVGVTDCQLNDELQIIDLQEGTGKAAVKGALITTQYTGTLEDGTVFDSSWERGKPFQCVIGTGRVIKGWDVGLMGMKVGGKRALKVPAHLAYGERSMGALIKSHSNLTFEIELLEVLTRDE